MSASTDTRESRLISDFVATAHNEVKESWLWRSMRHEIVLDLDSSKEVYDISDTIAGNGDLRNTVGVVCKMGSQLEFVNEAPNIFVFDDNNDNTGRGINVASKEAITRRRIESEVSPAADPEMVAIYPAEHATSLNLEIWPSLTGTRVLRAFFFTEPDDLESDGSTDNVEIIVPAIPVFNLALLYATQERGEDRHQRLRHLESMFLGSFARAIEQDIQIADRAGKYDWERR